jgi:hypothetical protein
MSPVELERIGKQVVIAGRHSNIFHGPEQGGAFLRFLVNRSLNLRKWKTGSHDYGMCVYCK